MASTPAITKTPRERKQPNAVAPRGTDLSEIETFIKEVTDAKQTAVGRDSIVEERFIAELRVLENEKASVAEKRSLADRLHDALTKSLDAEEADIDRAIARYRNGLLDGAEHQERTAA